MKLDQMQQAQRLFFQTDLTKTEIAATIGVSRTTLHYWIQQQNWAKLKRSAECIPVFLAENCYQILGNYTNYLLSEERWDTPPTPQEVNSMYKLTLIINKLKNRSTLNESMESFALLTDSIHDGDPELAIKVQPYVDNYIGARAAQNPYQYRPSRINEQGFIPTPDPAIEEKEAQLDTADRLAWADQQKSKAQSTTTSKSAVNARPVSSVPASQSASAGYWPESSSPLMQSFGKPVIPVGTPKVDLRKQLRGTATSGPTKNLRKTHPVAA
jgi:Putative ATPase subunit of terminase (gpP-like)